MLLGTPVAVCTPDRHFFLAHPCNGRVVTLSQVIQSGTGTARGTHGSIEMRRIPAARRAAQGAIKGVLAQSQERNRPWSLPCGLRVMALQWAAAATADSIAAPQAAGLLGRRHVNQAACSRRRLGHRSAGCYGSSTPTKLHAAAAASVAALQVAHEGLRHAGQLGPRLAGHLQVGGDVVMQSTSGSYLRQATGITGMEQPHRLPCTPPVCCLQGSLNKPAPGCPCPAAQACQLPRKQGLRRTCFRESMSWRAVMDTLEMRSPAVMSTLLPDAPLLRCSRPK